MLQLVASGDDVRDCFSFGTADEATTPFAKRMRSLIMNYGWVSKTMNTCISQWFAYVEFCSEGNRTPLPMAEPQTLAYIGWLANERDSGRRRVSCTSLEQYLSAIRLFHTRAIGRPVGPMLFLRDAIRAYQNWEEEKYPKLEQRAGLDAETIQSI